jgi:hypothetical protein
VEHVKPLREFLYDTFNAFAAAHPWVEGENVRPKSIAREMFEGYRSFADYVKDYGLERMEGLLLRHLTQVWKVLAQTVPDSAKTEEVAEMEVYFRELIRGVDASLLEEWERLKNPEWVAVETDDADKPARPASFDVTRDEKAFRRVVRAEIFAQMQRVLSWEDEYEAERAVFAAYGEARGRFRLDPEGRSAKYTHFGAVVTDGVVATAAVGELEVVQVLVDAEGANDWEAVFGVAMAASRAENRAVVRLVAVRAIGASAGEVSPME